MCCDPDPPRSSHHALRSPCLGARIICLTWWKVKNHQVWAFLHETMLHVLCSGWTEAFLSVHEIPLGAGWWFQWWLGPLSDARYAPLGLSERHTSAGGGAHFEDCHLSSFSCLLLQAFLIYQAANAADSPAGG